MSLTRATTGSPPPLPAARRGVVIEHLEHRFARGSKEPPVLFDVSLEIDETTFVSIIGPSGCGKSTLLRLIAGLLQPEQGSVSVFGEGPTEATRKKHIGFVPQSPALLPWRTVLENVELSLEVNRAMGERADPVPILERFGLGDVLEKRPGELSGGMAQRVAIARAVVFRPPVLVMDEPFSALDELTAEKLRAELVSWSEEERRTVVFVTHSVREAVLLSDRVVVLTPRPGRVAAEIAITLERPRDESVVETPAFLGFEAEIRDALRRAGAD